MYRYVKLEPVKEDIRRVTVVFESEIPYPRKPDIARAPSKKKFSDYVLLNRYFRGKRMLEANEVPPDVLGMRKNGNGHPSRWSGAHSDLEVVWGGHIYGYGGYAKMNRELLLRVSTLFRAHLDQQGLIREPFTVNPYLAAKLDLLLNTAVSDDAILVRGYTPRAESHKGYRICFTMMETQQVHPDFAAKLNANYDECWTPTRWNAAVFREGGVKIPIKVMPLGVNPHIYRPLDSVPPLPSCELLTTARAGAEEVPEGFLFLSLGQPTFRKGWEALVPAFENAFENNPDVALVLATTVGGRVCPPPFVNPRDLVRRTSKARVYMLSGQYTEHELAQIYNGCQAYVSLSRGEGWNLPLTEAAACGLPVIASRATSHLDLLDDSNAFLVDPTGLESAGKNEAICPWYHGQHFCAYGKQAHDQMVDYLRDVHRDSAKAAQRAERLTKKIRSQTWDRAADRAMTRLLGVHKPKKKTFYASVKPKAKRLLYLSCHSSLEYDEVKLFSELGMDVFSVGALSNPKKPSDPLRPGLDIADHKDLRASLKGLGDQILSTEAIQWADVIVVMHHPHWIECNWRRMKDKTVIWRSVGQSHAALEGLVARHRPKGMKVVRYSPLEKNTPDYCGHDAVIRFYKDPEEFCGWRGDKARAMTVYSGLRKRAFPVTEELTNYDLFERGTRNFDRVVFGPNNADLVSINGGTLSYEDMKEEMRRSRVYFYTGAMPTCYTLNFLEAWMTGIPVVGIEMDRPYTAPGTGHTNEMPSLIANGVSGFLSDDPKELSEVIRELMGNRKVAQQIGEQGRKRAIELFGKETIKNQWKEFFRSIT
jgi:glycosyltransferase involved in cell wall biosynthesis